MEYKHSESIKSILPAMIKTQNEMPQLNKDASNPHANSKYLTLDNILGALLPILNEQGVLLSQIPVQRKEDNVLAVGVDTLFLHESGEYFYYPGVFFEFEKGGRMNNTQSTGSIITYARRYELTSIFGISTNEDADGIQKDIDPEQARRDKKWAQFTKDRDELFERVKQLATDSMQSTKEVNKAMLSRISDEVGGRQLEITPKNIAAYNKQLRKAEVNFKEKQAENEANKTQTKQSSMFKGNSTQPVDWGNTNG